MVRSITFDEEKYQTDMDAYNEDMKVFKKVNGKYKVDCSELLVGRTIEIDAEQAKTNVPCNYYHEFQNTLKSC